MQHQLPGRGDPVGRSIVDLVLGGLDYGLDSSFKRHEKLVFEPLRSPKG